MPTNRTFSPAEICERFDISKTTLFRWEKEPWFPPVDRDLSGERQYTLEHIRVISAKQREQLGKQYGQAIERDGSRLSELAEAVSLRKFLEGNKTGLYELAEYPQPSRHTIDLLLSAAREQYEPDEDLFREILEVVLEQSRKLRHDKLPV